MNHGINVLSLFDGISVTQLALQQLGIKVKNYFAAEIDEKAIRVTQHHFPNTIQLGDVRNISGDHLPKIDLMVWGSPCQDLTSMRMNREGLEGSKSGLFYDAVRIMAEVKPKYFLMENVGSMSEKDKREISQILNVNGIAINSNLVSAQNRNRIYWTNIPGITIPMDRKIKFQDILERDFADREKSNCLLTKNIATTRAGLMRYLRKSVGQIVFRDVTVIGINKKDKLSAFDSFTKMGSNKKVFGDFFRKLSTIELERLQTLPDGYVGNILKPTPAHHAIGNSFTLEVIKHLFRPLIIGS